MQLIKHAERVTPWIRLRKSNTMSKEGTGCKMPKSTDHTQAKGKRVLGVFCRNIDGGLNCGQQKSPRQRNCQKV